MLAFNKTRDGALWRSNNNKIKFHICCSFSQKLLLEPSLKKNEPMFNTICQETLKFLVKINIGATVFGETNKPKIKS